MFKTDLFDPNISFNVEEANGDIGGKHILGKIKGCFFVPDGVSRNNRFYPKSLWEKVISSQEVKSKLEERRMFGTISHNQEIDEKAILEGKISHIITQLYINESGQGIGEAIILDTPAGRVLNTFLRAGSKLYVSSRANGSFKGEQNGIPSVDESSYELSGFDIVLDPGFVQANPKLVESLTKLIEESQITSDKINEEDLIMKEVIESLSKENAMLKVNLDATMAELKAIKETAPKEVEENPMLKTYEELGTPEEISKVFDLAEKYVRLGTPEEIKEAFTQTSAIVRKLKNLGTPEEIKEALMKSSKLVRTIGSIGTISEIKEALLASEVLLKKYRALGTPSELGESLDKAKKALIEYKDLGTPSEIKEAFEKTEKHFTAIKESKEAATVVVDNSAKISELAKELEVSETMVKEVYGKLTEDQIRKMFKKMSESKKMEKTFVKKQETKVISEEKEKHEAFSKTRGERLMEAFFR